MDTKAIVTVVAGGAAAALVLGGMSKLKLVPSSIMTYSADGSVNHINSIPKLGVYAGAVMGVTGIAAVAFGKSDTWRGVGAGALGAAGFILLTTWVAANQMVQTVQTTPSTAPQAKYQGVLFSTTSNQWMAIIQAANPDGTFGNPDQSNLRQVPIPGATDPTNKPTDAVAQAAIGTSGINLVAGNLRQFAGAAGSATLRMMEAGKAQQAAWQNAVRQRASAPPSLSKGFPRFARPSVSG